MIPDAPFEDSDSSTLPEIAPKTGQPEVLILVSATLGKRNDVVQRGAAVFIEPSKTVPTLIPIPGLDGADLALLPPRADC